MFWAISEPYLLPRTFWAWKKAHFLSILLILNLYSVALCCLNVDLPPPCHKHISKLSIALSPMSIELLDRFLDQKTWFFVFSKSYARFGAKGLKIGTFLKFITLFPITMKSFFAWESNRFKQKFLWTLQNWNLLENLFFWKIQFHFASVIRWEDVCHHKKMASSVMTIECCWFCLTIFCPPYWTFSSVP